MLDNMMRVCYIIIRKRQEDTKMLKKEIRWFIADHDLEIVIAIIAIIGLVVGLIIYNVCGQSSEETLDVVEWIAKPSNPASPLNIHF